MKTLNEILTEAMEYYETHGFEDQARLEEYMKLIEEALRLQMRSRASMEQMLRDQLKAVYDRLVQRGKLIKDHDGIGRFTLANVSARLHSELNRRILASANLIKLNRDEMIAKTLRRFSGWATSIPKGGSDEIDKRKLREEVVKPLRNLPFVERRVLIDQGHKLTSSISATLAHDGGAIAARWFSHWRQTGYNFREDHRERDGHIYLVRNSWAHKAGFVKAGPDGFSDEMTQPAEEPFCRCKFVYLYHLKQLPPTMITKKGAEAFSKAKMKA